MASDPHIQLPDRYELLRHLASGGMASVWCARDRVLGRHVAIKILAERYENDTLAVRRFKREARVAARLSSHPHVVTIFDVGTSRATPEAPLGRTFIVMEHLPGGTVADALRVGPVERDTALRWISQAAGALDYAHGRGVIHRDIKPANFLLDGGQTLHVADFGIARIGTEDTITSAGQLFGTAAYLSPEQALGQPATEASDRYALAVAAFELLTGERPFAADTFAAQARAHVDEPPPRASRRDASLPRAVDQVLIAGMAKDPLERWPTASAFSEALGEGLLTPRRPVAPLPRAAAAPVVLARSRTLARPLAAVALAAALVAIAVAAVGAVGGGGGKPALAARSRAAATAHPATATSAARTAPAHPRAAPKPASRTATTPASDPASLESRGHALMEAGDYPAAIDVLHQALAASAPGSLNYAYALFDLGRSLRLDGQPQAAIPILYQRLQIPDQTEVVREELQLALQAVGLKKMHASGGATPGPAAGPPPGHGHGHGHGHGGGPGDASD